MIALTQEKREEKIKRLNKIASWADSYGANHNVMIPALEAKEMAEAYIASITSEPIYQEKRFFESCGEFIEFWADVNKCTYDYIHESQRRILFTAPPVPEIKLPEKLSQYESLPLAGEDAWNECIDEIKRLNGLGE